MKTYIKGTYKRSIFTSDKGYVIGLFKLLETDNNEFVNFINKTITFTGYFHELNEDDNYIMYGEDIVHPKYGLQFNVSEYERIKPEDKDGIVAFLASDLFKGIGEKVASLIVEHLGDNTLNKILEDINNLYEIPKLSKKKADIIYNTLQRYEESHNTIVYLTEMGFSMHDALLIYNTYKQNTIVNIEHNIYNIINLVDDINFKTLDRIALNKGMDFLDERRLKALILYIFKNLTFTTGDVYLYYEDIYRHLCEYLNMIISDNAFKIYLDELIVEDYIVHKLDKYYLLNDYNDEEYIANFINRSLNLSLKENKKLDQYIKELEQINNIVYNDKQKEGIKAALNNNITIITGGPGTGKTTIIKAITQIYQNVNKLVFDDLINEVALLAPTGRASKRMSQATELPATTIHRFLKWDKDNNAFAVNEQNTSMAKILIVDEVSMIDNALMANLLRGINLGAKLVLVGDVNQLPSVGIGQILKDLIDSQLIKTINLDVLYRQEEGSYINVLAHDINNGYTDGLFETTNDYRFIHGSTYDIVPILKNKCLELLNDNGDNLQVMAPMYAGINGIDNLNKELQNIFNPASEEKRELKVGDVVFREHDKVLQLVNMPDDNVFNGDVGIIKYILFANTCKSKKNEIYVDFDGNVVKYLPKDFPKIKHGFVISIHKSQGSEFNNVIIPIVNSYRKMLYRKLIYTGITRAKQKLILIGEGEAFNYAVNNNVSCERKTDLINKLIMYKS